MSEQFLKWEKDPRSFAWRTVCRRYAVVVLRLDEVPERAVYVARYTGGPSDTLDYLGIHIGESPYRTWAENPGFSAEAICERHAWAADHAETASVSVRFPAVALHRFFWPISEGVTQGALAIVRDNGTVYARVVGMTRADIGGYESYTAAEIDLGELAIDVSSSLLENVTDHGPEHCNCGAKAEHPHKDGCSIARCLHDGRQRIMCEGVHDCGTDVWTGRWPGEAECEEFGWWCYFGPDYGEIGAGWVRCTADDPRATHDLNRLLTEARWDRGLRRWVLNPTTKGKDQR